MKLSNNLMKAAIALFCAAAMASCIHDDNHRTPSTGNKDAKLETVSISMDIPGEVKSPTRADSDLPEIDIVEVDVLQFRPDGTLAYRAVGTNITGNTSGDAGAGSGEREFETKLLSGTYDLVIVANARTQVNDAATGAGAWDESTTMQAALDRLAVTIDADERVFSPGDDQAALQHVPMFGITKDRTVDKDHRDHTVEMVRMVAKVDIQLGSTAVSDVFHISGARLYNQPLKGWVAPKISGWPANNVSTSAYFGGAAAPAKASYSGSPSDEPILTTEALPLEGIFDEIYLFEAPAGSEAGRNTNTCLVVEGGYSPDGVWPADEPSYYRVDFRRNTGTAQSPVWEYMPLLRNHHYTVVVNSVTGPGYPTPEEAFYGSARLEAEIVDWVQKPQNVIADGQYFLAVDKDLIELKGSGKRKEFTAETNYDIDDRGFPAGLQVKTAEVVYGPEDSGWLTVDDTNGLMARNIGMTATINVTGAVRTAKVMLRAGNMIKVIDVTQTPAGALAAPGTIGYSEETGELTLAGSMEYAGTIVAPDGTTAEFGPLSTETVYVAYYRWGSMVAIGSEDTGAFTASNVVWAPDDYVFSDGGTNYRGTEALKRRIGTASGATAWNMVPGRVDADGQELGWAAGTQGQALGDPCSLFGENWFMPIGGPSNKGWNGGTFGSLNGKTWEQVQGAPEYVQARWVPVPEIPATVAPNGGAITSDGTIFLPATGRRSTIGEMSRTTDLFYWSNTPANSYSGFSLGLAADWVYGSNNSDYKTAIAVRCVQEPVRNDVVFAAPGVVGIKKSAYDWLKRQRAIASQGSYGITWIPRTESDWSEYTAVHGHPLTIKGSSTYAGTWVETNIADGGKTTEFTANGYGGLETEPVYTVYFKWGSMIAMIGGEGDAWSMDDVVWVNPEFTGTITSDTGAASSDSNYGDFSAAPKDSSVNASPGQRDFGTLNPALGHGDICEEITGGTWRIPTGRPFATTKTYTGVNSGGTTYPFGDYRTTNPGRTWEQSRGTDNGVTYWRDASSHTAGTLGGYSVASHVPIGFFSGTQGQGVSDNQDLFLPAAGYRLSSGLQLRLGSDGPYWSSSAIGDAYGCSLNFTSSLVYSTYGSAYANGFPVRCVVVEPAPEIVKPTKGVLAPPGVLGVGATTGKLTLHGAKEFADTPVATRADGQGTTEFGDLADETVYIAYWKWGSVIGVVAGPISGSYVSSQVAWAPDEFKQTPEFEEVLTGDWSAIPYVDQTALPHPAIWPAANDNLAGGIGDPCKLADGGEFSEYKVPTGNSVTGWNNVGLDGENLTVVSPTYYDGVSLQGWRNSDWSMYIPYTGGILNDAKYANTAQTYMWSENSFGDSRSYITSTASAVWKPVSGGQRAWGGVIRCVEPAPEPAPVGVHAPPGMIGYKADGTLTLSGSSVYAADEDIAKYATDEFGGLEKEHVYVALFRFGSLVAVSSRDEFETNDVIAGPSEWAGYAALKANPTWAGVPLSPGIATARGTIGTNLSEGLGDPCDYYFGDGDGDGNGEGSTWRLPTRDFYSTYILSNTAWSDEGDLGTDIPAGRLSNRPGEAGWYYPAVGFRNADSGSMNYEGVQGYYWTSNARTTSLGYNFSVTKSNIYPTNSSSYKSGMAVRCVEPAPVEPVFEVVDTQIDAFTHLGGSRSVAVTSTIDDEPAAWTAQFSVDGGAYSSTAPAWLAGFPTSGAGSITAETYTMSPAPFSLISNNMDFVGAGTRGSTGSPWNLAGNPANADLSNASDWETANSYIVNNPGWYSLPLAYGNAIKGGSFNPHSYLAEGAASTTFLKNFIRHDGKGISGSYIYNQTTPFDSPIGDATLLWQDVPGMLTDIKLDAAKEKLLFRIDADYISQGNAVVAVRDAAGAIMWSWHIWVTPSRIVNAMNPKAATRATKTFAGEYNDIMEYALGFVGTGTDVWAARSVSVRITQTGTGETKAIALSHPEKAIANGLVSTYYQWGRKDAMIPSNGNNDESRVVEWGVRKDGNPYNTTGAAATGEPAATIQNSQPTSAANVGDITKSIVNPHVFYLRNGDWNAGTTTPEGPGRTSVNNLWSVENTGMKVNDDVIKTVYDPSPAGFKMPLMDVWTGFTSNGGNQNGEANSGNWNVPQPVSSNPFASGWAFYFDGWQTGETSLYAAFGYRYATGGGVGSVASSGSYWSAIPYSASAGCDFTTRNNIVCPLNGNNRGFGFAVRPMAE